MHRVLSRHNANKYAVELAQCLVDGVLYLNQHSFTLYEAEIAINSVGIKCGKEQLLQAIQRLHTYSTEA